MAEPSLAALSFDNSVVTPVAQVTVIDAFFGDSNLVDFCRLPLQDYNGKKEYEEETWRRTLIDTGPSFKIGKQIYKAQLAKTLLHVISKQELPSPPNGDAITEIPKLDRLLITHPDDDHIGQAATLLKALSSDSLIPGLGGDKYISRVEYTEVAFCTYPELYERPIIRPSAPDYEKDIHGDEYNTVTFTVGFESRWKRDLENAGFAVNLTMTPPDPGATIASVGVKWTQVSPTQWTLTYTEACVSGGGTPYLPQLTATTELFYNAPAELTTEILQKKKTSKKAGKVTLKDYVAIKPDKLKPTVKYTLVPLNATQLGFLNTKIIRPFTKGAYKLEWVGASPKKLKRNSSSMAMFLPMTRSTPQPTRTPAVDVRVPIHVLNVKQVSNLQDTIYELNDRLTKPLSLTSVMTAKGDVIQENVAGQISGREVTVGPSTRAYRDLMQNIMLTRYSLDKSPNPPDLYLEIGGRETNRASIVSMYEVPNRAQAPPITQKFSMLFTGDAFDEACDIRETLAQWKTGKWDGNVGDDAIININVLKIPHHGSAETADSGFYKFVRAEVYLISGSHQANEHGNPRLSTLRAIIRGFKGKKRPKDRPFRLFFSSTNINVDFINDQGKLKARSAVAAILADPAYKATDENGDLYYEMWRLSGKDAAGVNIDASYQPFGSILFGMDATWNLVTQWNQYQWVKCI